ncbi:hypothetical protein [Burkholderia mayonis]|uniref:hypothetical protein n=1 Tax=Burkholderia mayonis TaxID=1385591 RepID=UPI00131F4393|nr:hypothetical protein [Burkholderia mayonis]
MKLVAGIPIAGIPIAGNPVAVNPIAVNPIAGIPIAGNVPAIRNSARSADASPTASHEPRMNKRPRRRVAFRMTIRFRRIGHLVVVIVVIGRHVFGVDVGDRRNRPMKEHVRLHGGSMNRFALRDQFGVNAGSIQRKRRAHRRFRARRDQSVRSPRGATPHAPISDFAGASRSREIRDSIVRARAPLQGFGQAVRCFLARRPTILHACAVPPERARSDRLHRSMPVRPQFKRVLASNRSLARRHTPPNHASGPRATRLARHAAPIARCAARPRTPYGALHALHAMRPTPYVIRSYACATQRHPDGIGYTPRL